MVDESDKLVLRMLRHMDTKLDRIGEDVRDLKERVTAVDLGMAGVRRELAALAEADARLSVRMDRIDGRLERIERRLDLVEA